MMASKGINIVAIIYPKKGKADEVVAMLKDVAAYTQENEPDVLRYEVNRTVKPNKEGLEEVVMVETYKDQNALKTHSTSDKFTAFQKKLAKAELIRAPMMLKMLSKQAGFSSRL